MEVTHTLSLFDKTRALSSAKLVGVQPKAASFNMWLVNLISISTAILQHQKLRDFSKAIKWYAKVGKDTSQLKSGGSSISKN